MARRLAAILIADVVGYSRLMQADEGRTLAVFSERLKTIVEPLVRGKEGRIVKMLGDGILAEFASAVNAVQCAYEIQSRMAEANSGLSADLQMAMRIGVNIGDVVVEGDDLHGDGVNVAARLEALAEPGSVLISAAVFSHVRGKVDLAFEERGEKTLKNIVEPVRVYKVVAPGEGASDTPLPALPNKPSIAVLPFQNMSGDPEQEYFADGMVEEIITALSRMRWLFVIARNSSFVYKGRAVDVKQVGRELGVRYVLEGSVRRAANRVRITGQLIEAATGAHIWADRFEGSIEDIFDLQDQVTASVVGAIAPKLEQAEIERIRHKPTHSLDAYDCYLRATAAYHRWSREANEEALGMALRAIKLDPQFASAWSIAARFYVQRVSAGWIADPAHEFAECERLARRAVELGKDDAVVLATAGFAIGRVNGELEEGVALIDRALALNPNLATAWSTSSILRAFLGESETAIEHATRCLRLSPNDPYTYGAKHAMALAHLFAGRAADAASWSETAARENPNNLVIGCTFAASAARAGRLADAQRTVARLRERNASLNISLLKVLMPIRRPEDWAAYADALRQAGMPE